MNLDRFILHCYKCGSFIGTEVCIKLADDFFDRIDIEEENNYGGEYHDKHYCYDCYRSLDDKVLGNQ